MPNGSHLNEADYEALDSLVRPLDAGIERFANSIGATFSSGYHGVPDRRIELKLEHDGIERGILLCPRFVCHLSGHEHVATHESERALLVDAVAYKDYPFETVFVQDDEPYKEPPSGRRIWNVRIQQAIEAECEVLDIEAVLRKAYDSVTQALETDLVPWQ